MNTLVKFWRLTNVSGFNAMWEASLITGFEMTVGKINYFWSMLSGVK